VGVVGAAPEAAVAVVAVVAVVAASGWHTSPSLSANLCVFPTYPLLLIFLKVSKVTNSKYTN
jgi:hypothetical protein